LAGVEVEEMRKELCLQKTMILSMMLNLTIGMDLKEIIWVAKLLCFKTKMKSIKAILSIKKKWRLMINLPKLKNISMVNERILRKEMKKQIKKMSKL
jgi:hypothetical protein